MRRTAFCNPFLLLGAALCLLGACHDQAPPAAPAAMRSLGIRDIAPGAGQAAGSGQTVAVDYMGWLYDESVPDHKGRLFDSSSAGGAPLRFTLGAGQVIAGWEQGILGMKVRGRRELVIPPQLAYGERGAPPLIPPGATLLFDVELVSLE